VGVCKLTLKEGVFVKSHILPKSLTRPSFQGSQFLEGMIINGKKKFTKRRDSWYDKSLVTRCGEDILADLDSFGIKELRDKGLVWSSKEVRGLPRKAHEIKVEFNQPERLRLYFLSLLWRAAATSLNAFSGVKLKASEVEKLRRILIGETADDKFTFPMSVVQIYPRGLRHNMAPVKESVPFFGGTETLRFYHDGLIITFYLEAPIFGCMKPKIPYKKPYFVGNDCTDVTQVLFNQSHQLQLLMHEVVDYFSEFPERIQK